MYASGGAPGLIESLIKPVPALQPFPASTKFGDNHLGHGWAVAEFSVETDRWSGGAETPVILTASYIWRAARRTELLVGMPVGLTSSADQIGAVIKLTFELGGEP